MGWFRTLRRGVTWVSLGAAGGAVYITARHLLQTPQPLESILPGEARIDRRHGGDVFYNVAGPDDAAPLVLLHDFYPGASNFEFRNIFGRLATTARVYAPDWLGFGMSEHPHVAYTGEFYAGVLGGFLRDTVRRPATVLAHGLAGNIAVRAASDTPDLFDRLILVSPAVTVGEGPEPTAGQTVVRTVQRAALGLVPYAVVSSRPALRWIANGRSATSGADEEQVDHLFASAHQFGGQHALLALLTGELDLPMRNALQTLRPPMLLVVGADDPKRPRDAMEEMAVLNPHADLEIVPDAGSAVFEDQPAAFIDAVEAWIGVPKPRNIARPSVQNASTYLGAPVAAAHGQENAAGAASEGETYVSSLLPPMNDMGADVGMGGEVDESPLLPPMDDMGAGRVRGLARLAGTSQEDASGAPANNPPQSTGATGATEDQVGTPAGAGVPVRDTATPGARDHTPPFEEEVGGAGYVTPGVSDMGIEGPNTDTINSGTVPTGETEGRASDTGATAGAGESPADLIPEAGDVAGEGNRDELEAREGVSPPVDAGMNIADPSLVGSAEGADEGAGEGPATGARGKGAGRTRSGTTDTAVAMPSGETEEGELPTRPVRATRAGARPAPEVVPASEDAPEAQSDSAAQRQARDRAESATRPLNSRERPSQSTRAASRPSGARTSREGGAAKGGTGGSGGGTGGSGLRSRRHASGGKGGSRSGHTQGHKK